MASYVLEAPRRGIVLCWRPKERTSVLHLVWLFKTREGGKHLSFESEGERVLGLRDPTHETTKRTISVQSKLN